MIIFIENAIFQIIKNQYNILIMNTQMFTPNFHHILQIWQLRHTGIKQTLQIIKI